MDLETDSITERLEEKGIVFADAEHVIDAVAASAEDARLLGVRPRAPCCASAAIPATFRHAGGMVR